MSSATDFLLYASPSDKGVEPFCDLIAAEARFEARPLRVDTTGWNGPNVFMGGVWAFGADYFNADVQALLDRVKWTRPEQVVVLVRREGGQERAMGHHPHTHVYRPAFTVHQDGWQSWITQDGPA